jgi:hypothetical protein
MTFATRQSSASSTESSGEECTPTAAGRMRRVVRRGPPAGSADGRRFSLQKRAGQETCALDLKRPQTSDAGTVEFLPQATDTHVECAPSSGPTSSTVVAAVGDMLDLDSGSESVEEDSTFSVADSVADSTLSVADVVVGDENSAVPTSAPELPESAGRSLKKRVAFSFTRDSSDSDDDSLTFRRGAV